MAKFYHMIIGRPGPENVGDTSTRREYISRRQGEAPDGWVCVGVCGYHESVERMVQYPCRNCVYFKQCGENMRTAPCDGRVTKSQKKMAV